MAASGGPIGGSGSVDIYSEDQDLFVLFAGVPGDIVPVPQFNGQMWVNLAATIQITSGTLGPSARFTLPYSVPNETRFVGITLGWSAAAGPLTSLSFAPPTFSVHGM